MMNNIEDIIFLEEAFTYCILDAAGSDKISLKLFGNECEYRVLAEESEMHYIEDVSPHLVKLSKEKYPEITEWVLNDLYGKKLTLFFNSKKPINDLATLFLSFTKAKYPKLEEDSPDWVYFAFNAVEIFEDFLEIIPSHNIELISNSVNRFYCEDYINPSTLRVYNLNKNNIEKTVETINV